MKVETKMFKKDGSKKPEGFVIKQDKLDFDGIPVHFDSEIENEDLDSLEEENKDE